MNQKLFHKDFTLVVIGQIISLFGNGIVRFALPLYLLNQTGSPSLFGIVTALSFLPMILLMPMGGIIADRVNKRNVMVILDFLTAILMTALYFLLGNVDTVILLIVTLMVLYGIMGTYQPAVSASMPLLHGPDNLLTANAVINQVNALAGLAAPVLGGILFGVWGLVPIIIVGGTCFFLSAVMECFIHIPHTKREEKISVFQIVTQDFKESFRFMRKEKPVILKTIGVICSLNLFLSAMAIVAMPVLITQHLGMSDQLYGISMAVLAAGGLGGGIMVGVLAKKLSINRLYVLLFILSCLLLPIGLTLWLNLPAFVSYLVISVSGFLIMSVATMATILLITFVQGETPTALTGKVISWVMALAMCAQPLGQAMYGFLFESFSGDPYLVVFGGALCSAVVALFSVKVFKGIQTIKPAVEGV